MPPEFLFLRASGKAKGDETGRPSLAAAIGCWRRNGTSRHAAWTGGPAPPDKQACEWATSRGRGRGDPL